MKAILVRSFVSAETPPFPAVLPHTNLRSRESYAVLALHKLRWILSALAELFSWLSPAELVRQVAPGQPPLRRHEWEGSEIHLRRPF